MTLEAWLEEEEEHRKYFEKALKYYNEGSAFDKNPPDIQREWLQIRPKLNGPTQTRGKSILKLGVAVAAAVTILFVSTYFFYEDKSYEDKSNIQTTDSSEIIRAGESKATLILHDGNRHDISDDTNLSIQSGGSEINSEGSSLSYIPKSTESVELQFNTLITPRGGEFYVELSDGTKVWINAQSSLKYPVQFLGGERTIELIGEAYFEVAHDESKPFHVISGNQKIDVLGTTFNISAYEEDDFVTTTLVEGKVNVYQINEEQNGAVLIPNQQSILNKVTGEISQKEVDINQFVAWKAGRFYFQEQSVTTIMKVLSRWYDINVFFDDDEVGDVRFTGGFQRYENFEQVQNLLEKTEEIEFMVKGKTVIIK